MSKMREIDGYMTVEMSMILPIVCLALLLLMGYLCYFMNCGIVQGTVEEIAVKAADTCHGGDYDTGEVSYAAMNRRNLYMDMFPEKEKAADQAQKELEKELSAHLFLGKISKISIKEGISQMQVSVGTYFNVPGASMLKMFGIRIFEHQGSCQISYLSEMEKVRGWSVVERALD